MFLFQLACQSLKTMWNIAKCQATHPHIIGGFVTTTINLYLCNTSPPFFWEIQITDLQLQPSPVVLDSTLLGFTLSVLPSVRNCMSKVTKCSMLANMVSSLPSNDACFSSAGLLHMCPDKCVCWFADLWMGEKKPYLQKKNKNIYFKQLK